MADDYSNDDFDSISVSKSITVSQAKKNASANKKIYPEEKKKTTVNNKFAQNYSPIKEEGANPNSDSLTQSK